MSLIRPAQHMPFPEAVEDEAPAARPYLIIDSSDKPWLATTGMVDKVARKMYVPLSERGRPVARHELAHVKFSPRRMPRVGFDARILQAVEDARINMAMERVGLPVRLCAEDCALVRRLVCEDLARGDVVALAIRAIAALGADVLECVLAPIAHGRGDAAGLVRRLARLVEARLERARARRSVIAPFKAALRAAEEVARELSRAGFSCEGGAGGMVLVGACCPFCEDLLEAPASDRAGRFRRGRAGSRRSGADRPGEMSIVEAPLEIACAKARPMAAGWRASAEGAVVRYPNRWFNPINRAVFRERVRARGGSVLVDVSGSMRLDEAGVERILREAPCATLVAIYSGRGGQGELRIVARAGKRAKADKLSPFGGANVVDVPALEWLAKQPAPRIWISDGRVTGVGDQPSAAIAAACRSLCARHRIRRVRNAEEAARALEGRGGPALPAVP